MKQTKNNLGPYPRVGALISLKASRDQSGFYICFKITEQEILKKSINKERKRLFFDLYPKNKSNSYSSNILPLLSNQNCVGYSAQDVWPGYKKFLFLGLVRVVTYDIRNKPKIYLALLGENGVILYPESGFEIVKEN